MTLEKHAVREEEEANHTMTQGSDRKADTGESDGYYAYYVRGLKPTGASYPDHRVEGIDGHQLQADFENVMLSDKYQMVVLGITIYPKNQLPLALDLQVWMPNWEDGQGAETRIYHDRVRRAQMYIDMSTPEKHTVSI